MPGKQGVIDSRGASNQHDMLPLTRRLTYQFDWCTLHSAFQAAILEVLDNSTGPCFPPQDEASNMLLSPSVPPGQRSISKYPNGSI